MDVFTRKEVGPEWAHRTRSGEARTRNPGAAVRVQKGFDPHCLQRAGCLRAGAGLTPELP